MTASLDATTSTDPDGTVASYAWDFGDSSPAGAGVKPTHTYATAGTYSVTLTVTDNKGATNSVSHDVMVAVSNQAPVAAFTAGTSGLVAALDASGSSDPDGTIAGYSWNFGDSQPAATTKTVNHTYATAGTYTVSLTVTDNQGATATVSHPVTVTAAQGAFASDLFARTVASGWGSADQGGAWAVSGTGGAANFSVAAGTAKLRLPSASATDAATLSGVSQTDADVKVAFTSDLPATGGGVYFNTTVRRVGTSFYSAKVLVGSTGKVTLSLARTVSGTETVLKSAVATGITYTPGMVSAGAVPGDRQRHDRAEREGVAGRSDRTCHLVGNDDRYDGIAAVRGRRWRDRFPVGHRDQCAGDLVGHELRGDHPDPLTC